MMKLVALFILTISVLFFPGSQADIFGEEAKELVYFDIEKNNELIKEEISNAFWENPLNTPPFLIIIGISILLMFGKAFYQGPLLHDASN